MTAVQRREAVVRVAVEVFAREGFHATTTVAIADLAGVSQPYLFRLFDSKRAVFLAAAELATADAARAFTAAAGDADGVAALRAGERAWRRMVGAGSPFAFQWQLHAAAAADPVIRAAAARHWGVLWRTVASTTGLPDPALAAFFGRMLLVGATCALRPGPPPSAARPPRPGRPFTTATAPTARGTRAAPAPAAARPRPAAR
ncbi:helix-turn-helix domain-containing protein [Kitasatospora sp. NPDC059646]|uniref:TetR/AcrR family transcriptional regulator n=1 Tax=Kitasatospora sp. NPDC059646 TaxID=3346893 RepID=UPI0036CDD970